MQKSTNEYESVKKYTDAELLEMWLRGWSADELAKMLHREDKKIRIKDARMRIDKITTRWNFENQGLPALEMRKRGGVEMKIIDKKIQLMPHESKIGYVVCKKCAGVGWLMTDDEKYIEQCRECNGTGLNRICAHCGNIYTIACYCDGAIASRRKTAEEQEQKRYEKARKISLYDAKQYEMFYSDKYRGNEGYFNAEDIYDIMNYYDLGSYVWGTTYSPLKIYASDIVSNATEDSWEGAYDAINPYDIAKLQEQLDDFCNKANKSGAGTYDVDYTTAILL